MNRLLFLLLASSVAAMPMHPQSKLDAPSRVALRQGRVAAALNPRLNAPRMADTLNGFITLRDGYTVADIAIDGLVCHPGRTSLIPVSFPAAAIAELEGCEAVKSVTLERGVAPKMDRVRALTGIDAIHSGEGLPQGYTGKGVLAAIVDGGFDPNHVNFKNPDGTSRIENFTYFRPLQSGGYNTETYGADYIPNIDTESSLTFHGTHTLGIMAGSYRGTVKAGMIDADATDPEKAVARVTETANPYYGIATDAAISVASGAETDYYVALGVDQSLNYAYWKANDTGRPWPVVLNLSMGSNVGPHDGSSTLSRYLDELVTICEEDGIPFIPCISAGNEGDYPIALHKTFSADDAEMKSAFLSLNYLPDQYPNMKYGQVYLYSDSDLPFEIQAVVVNKSRGRVALQNVLPAVKEGGIRYLCSSANYVVDTETDQVSEQLARYFNGYFGVMAQVDTDYSGRYMAIVDMMLSDADSNDGNYVAGFIVKGAPGQRVDAYCTGEWFHLNAMGMEDIGFVDGTTDGSISDLATGRKAIVVGSYNARNFWASVDGNIYGYDHEMFANNAMSYFSSYGNLIDGRTLPTVCAPGATIISSSNEYYLQDEKIGDYYRQAFCEADGRRYSWHQCVGTSMATPVVTGSIALWLEADPTLTFDAVRNIIVESARVDNDVLSTGRPEQWGAGKFDAYAGLKMLLTQKAGIGTVAADNSEPLLTYCDGGFTVCIPGASLCEAALYATDGTLVRRSTADCDSVTFATASLARGVYICKVNNKTVKIVVK